MTITTCDGAGCGAKITGKPALTIGGKDYCADCTTCRDAVLDNPEMLASLKDQARAARERRMADRANAHKAVEDKVAKASAVAAAAREVARAAAKKRSEDRAQGLKTTPAPNSKPHGGT